MEITAAPRLRFAVFRDWATRMWLRDWLFSGKGHNVAELARRLDVPTQELQQCVPDYRRFTIPKRSGGQREILAPSPELKQLQRKILRRLLSRLKAHPAANGFEKGKSIVTNARPHTGQAVVIRMDLEDFFTSTTADRVHRYFRQIGWNRPASRLLTRLCTHEGGLPQGAPTSPRLSNLVNYPLDARLTGLARRFGGVYTRYADDITLSFAIADPQAIHAAGSLLRRILGEAGYRVHRRKKYSVRRRHQQQVVTGLVVNESVNLPRAIRRWLRAVDYRLRQEGERRTASAPLSPPPPVATLTPAQRDGWQAFQQMIAQQRE